MRQVKYRRRRDVLKGADLLLLRLGSGQRIKGGHTGSRVPDTGFGRKLGVRTRALQIERIIPGSHAASLLPLLAALPLPLPLALPLLTALSMPPTTAQHTGIRQNTRQLGKRGILMRYLSLICHLGVHIAVRSLNRRHTSALTERRVVVGHCGTGTVASMLLPTALPLLLTLPCLLGPPPNDWTSLIPTIHHSTYYTDYLSE